MFFFSFRYWWLEYLKLNNIKGHGILLAIYGIDSVIYLSQRRTAVILRLDLFTAKRDTLEKLEVSDKYD